MRIIKIEMTTDKAEALDELINESGVQTEKELFNKALTLFKWYVGEKNNRMVVTSMETDKYEEYIKTAQK